MKLGVEFISSIVLDNEVLELELSQLIKQDF